MDIGHREGRGHSSDAGHSLRPFCSAGAALQQSVAGELGGKCDYAADGPMSFERPRMAPGAP